MENNVIDILLVEDNPFDAELTLRALKAIKILNHVQVLTDGEEALNYLFGLGEYEGRDLNLNPKVIFLDLKLPKVDGLEILKRLKSDERTKTIPVVIVTSSKEERDVVKSYKLGVNSYIVKPVNSDNFIEAIKELGFYWLILNQPPK